MKEIQISGSTYLLVKLKLNASNFSIMNGKLRYENKENHLIRYVPIPPGQWYIIGKADELKWGDVVGIIEKENDGSGLNGWWYRDYSEEDKWTKHVMDSFKSLLTHNGYEFSKTLILVKQ